MAATILGGEGATGRLLVFSQVVLSLGLPFAMIPLVWFTYSRADMGQVRTPRALSLVAAMLAAVPSEETRSLARERQVRQAAAHARRIAKPS